MEGQGLGPEAAARLDRLARSGDAARLRELCGRFAAFPPLPGAVVPADSLLREFIGAANGNGS